MYGRCSNRSQNRSDTGRNGGDLYSRYGNIGRSDVRRNSRNDYQLIRRIIKTAVNGLYPRAGRKLSAEGIVNDPTDNIGSARRFAGAY